MRFYPTIILSSINKKNSNAFKSDTANCWPDFDVCICELLIFFFPSQVKNILNKTKIFERNRYRNIRLKKLKSDKTTKF